jgi:hypothetical protein
MKIREGDTMESIEEKMEELTPELQKEVMDFVDFLLQKEEKIPKRKLKLDWTGGLKEYMGKYTSVEFQHEISQWRLGDELNRH